MQSYANSMHAAYRWHQETGQTREPCLWRLLDVSTIYEDVFGIATARCADVGVFSFMWLLPRCSSSITRRYGLSNHRLRYQKRWTTAHLSAMVSSRECRLLSYGFETC
jgi:hypothetical protein